MPRESIVQILIRRDGMSKLDAENLMEDAQKDFNDRLMNGEDCEDFCADWFGLEPDYLDEFFNLI